MEFKEQYGWDERDALRRTLTRGNAIGNTLRTFELPIELETLGVEDIHTTSWPIVRDQIAELYKKAQKKKV